MEEFLEGGMEMGDFEEGLENLVRLTGDYDEVEKVAGGGKEER